MEQLLFTLLEQTPVIIALGVGIYALWKDKKETKVEMTVERKSLRKEIIQKMRVYKIDNNKLRLLD